MKIILHGLRDKAGQGGAGLEPPPDVRGRNVQGVEGHQKDPAGLEHRLVGTVVRPDRPHPVPQAPAQNPDRRVKVRARPAGDDEQALAEDVFIVLPGLDLDKGVRAQDEKDPGLGIEPLELLQGQDGIGFAPGLDLNIARMAPGPSGAGQLEHPQSVPGRGDVPQVFVGRDVRRDEQDLVQAEPPSRVFGRTQMPEMDRVECPSQDADALSLHRRVHPALGRSSSL